VTAGGVKITPPMGLTAWVAFSKMKNHDMIMGDTVLTEDQVNPVMSVALGELAKGVYKLTIGKKTKMGGHEMGNAMGVNTCSRFKGRSQDPDLSHKSLIFL